VGRRSTIEQHPKRKEIERDLADGSKTLGQISKKYGLTQSSVHRYLHTQFVDKASKAKEVQQMRDGDRIYEEIRKVMERTQKMYDACDEFLTDPEDPGKYWLGPRASEVDVAFFYKDDEKRNIIRKRLDEVWSTIESEGERVIVEMDYRRKDPRELLLKTAVVLNRQLELIAEVLGKIASRDTGGDLFIALLTEVLKEHDAGTNRT